MEKIINLNEKGPINVERLMFNAILEYLNLKICSQLFVYYTLFQIAIFAALRL